MERVLIAGLRLNSESMENFENSIDEMIGLIRTAGAEVVDTIYQNRDNIDPTFYIGKGKIEEIKEYISQFPEITTVAFDNELNPRQVRNLTQFLNVKIIDRTEIILSIFATRARTNEAQLEVELAQLNYLLPRLTRMWSHLHRQAGGIGSRGPGESQLEVDRRIVRNKIALLNKKLKKVESHRDLIRQQRIRKNEPVVAIVGYTNAGKSTLLKSLSHKEIYIANKLFATLDPVMRRVYLPQISREVLFTDTVGFIRKLPHTLVESFKSTLEEIIYADVIVHVIDASSEHYPEDIKAVETVLKEINADMSKIIEAYNKIDLVDPQKITEFKNKITISALEGDNDQLLEAVTKRLKKQFSLNGV